MAENTTYDCAASGHIFGPWQPQTGMPKPTSRRVCVIPGCYEVERKDTPIVRTTA